MRRQTALLFFFVRVVLGLGGSVFLAAKGELAVWVRLVRCVLESGPFGMRVAVEPQLVVSSYKTAVTVPRSSCIDVEVESRAAGHVAGNRRVPPLGSLKLRPIASVSGEPWYTCLSSLRPFWCTTKDCAYCRLQQGWPSSGKTETKRERDPERENI